MLGSYLGGQILTFVILGGRTVVIIIFSILFFLQELYTAPFGCRVTCVRYVHHEDSGISVTLISYGDMSAFTSTEQRSSAPSRLGVDWLNEAREQTYPRKGTFYLSLWPSA